MDSIPWNIIIADKSILYSSISDLLLNEENLLYYATNKDSSKTLNDTKKYIQRLIKNNNLETSLDDYSIDLDDDRKKLFMKEIKSFNADDYDEGPFKLEEEMSCKEFGHICPAYFASELFTETKKGRKRSRNISFETKVRVMRRDNYICQICGKHLLDREVEFDHIIPYSKGGHSDESNIRVTCSKCNKNKSNKISEVMR